MTVYINGTTGISGVDGSAGTPAVQGTDTNTGVFYPAADTIAWATGGSEKMRVDSSGNVGIGTSNTPSNKDTVTPKFVVNGTGVAGAMQVVRNTTPGAGGGIIELTATRGSDVNSYTILQSGDGIGSVIFGGADGNEFVQAASIVAAVDGTPGDNDMPGRLVFNTTADGASSVTERMRIDSNGNLLVGTTSDPGGSARVGIKGSGTTISTVSLYIINSSSVGNFLVYDNGAINTGTTSAGSPYVNTTATAANAVLSADGFLRRSTSSLKYKTDIQDATHGLTDLLKLRSVTYKGKNDGDIIFGGLIAEEVDAAGLNEFVQYAADGSPDAINYGNMVSLCIKAIQEQQALITALTARITALENK